MTAEPQNGLRILFVTQYFHPEQFSNNTVVEELVRRGHRVDVMTAVPNYPAGRFFDGYGFTKRSSDDYMGARVRRIPVVPRGHGNSAKLALNYASFVVSGLAYQWRYRRRDFDIVIASAPSPLTLAIPAIAFARRARIPSTLWVQDLWPETPIALLHLDRRGIVRPLTALCRWIYRNIDVLLVPSRAYEQPIRELAPSAKFHFLPNTITPDMQPLPADLELRTATGFAPDDIVIAYAGNIGEAQNLGLVVDAVSAISANPEAACLKFLILGDGRDRERIQQLVADRGLKDRFVFTGSVPAARVPHYLSFADGALLTLRDDPVFAPVIPYRMQTFLAYAKPLLASTSGESARLIAELGCGLVAPAGDVAGFADNLVRFARLSPDERRRQGEAGRAFAVAEFDRQHVLDRFDTLLRQLAAKA